MECDGIMESNKTVSEDQESMSTSIDDYLLPLAVAVFVTLLITLPFVEVLEVHISLADSGNVWGYTTVKQVPVVTALMIEFSSTDTVGYRNLTILANTSTGETFMNKTYFVQNGYEYEFIKLGPASKLDTLQVWLDDEPLQVIVSD